METFESTQQVQEKEDGVLILSQSELKKLLVDFPTVEDVMKNINVDSNDEMKIDFNKKELNQYEEVEKDKEAFQVLCERTIEGLLVEILS